MARILGAHPPRETAHEEEAPSTGSGAACFRGPSERRLAVHNLVASVRGMAGEEAKHEGFTQVLWLDGSPDALEEAAKARFSVLPSEWSRWPEAYDALEE